MNTLYARRLPGPVPPRFLAPAFGLPGDVAVYSSPECTPAHFVALFSGNFGTCPTETDRSCRISGGRYDLIWMGSSHSAADLAARERRRERGHANLGGARAAGQTRGR